MPAITRRSSAQSASSVAQQPTWLSTWMHNVQQPYRELKAKCDSAKASVGQVLTQAKAQAEQSANRVYEWSQNNPMKLSIIGSVALQAAIGPGYFAWILAGNVALASRQAFGAMVRRVDSMISATVARRAEVVAQTDNASQLPVAAAPKAAARSRVAQDAIGVPRGIQRRSRSRGATARVVVTQPEASTTRTLRSRKK